MIQKIAFERRTDRAKFSLPGSPPIIVKKWQEPQRKADEIEAEAQMKLRNTVAFLRFRADVAANCGAPYGRVPSRPEQADGMRASVGVERAVQSERRSNLLRGAGPVLPLAACPPGHRELIAVSSRILDWKALDEDICIFRPISWPGVAVALANELWGPGMGPW